MELLFRPRRLRRREPLRRMVRETHLRPENFIYPMFAAPGSRVRQAVPSMPGVARLSADLLVEEAKAALNVGVPAVLLFGLPLKVKAMVDRTIGEPAEIPDYSQIKRD